MVQFVNQCSTLFMRLSFTVPTIRTFARQRKITLRRVIRQGALQVIRAFGMNDPQLTSAFHRIMLRLFGANTGAPTLLQGWEMTSWSLIWWSDAVIKVVGQLYSAGEETVTIYPIYLFKKKLHRVNDLDAFNTSMNLIREHRQLLVSVTTQNLYYMIKFTSITRC